MSEQDKQSGVIVGGRYGLENKSGRRWLNWRLYIHLWIVPVICVGALVIAVLVLYLSHHNENQAPSSSNKTQNAIHNSPLSANDFNNLQTAYDKDIASNSNNPPAQALPYMQKARLYMLQKDYKDALSSALKSYSLQPTNLITIETIGDIYADMGNNQAAVSYYQKDIAVFNASILAKQPGGQQTVQYYQQKINSLPSSPGTR